MIAPALASALALAAPEAAAGISTQPAAVAPAAAEGVISYPAAFFADSQAANAWEMLLRLPGFTLDTGDKIRGFEGGVAPRRARPAGDSDHHIDQPPPRELLADPFAKRIVAATQRQAVSDAGCRPTKQDGSQSSLKLPDVHNFPRFRSCVMAGQFCGLAR